MITSSALIALKLFGLIWGLIIGAAGLNWIMERSHRNADKDKK